MRGPILFAAALMAAIVPASGQTEASAEQAALDRLKIEVEMAKLRAEQDKLRLEGTKARIEALGLPKAEGKTTLGTDAGKLEGWMLASRAVEAAAGVIAGQAQVTGPVALLGTSDRIDVGAVMALPREMGAVTAALYGLSFAACRVATPVRAMSATALIGAGLSLLRTDTEVSGFSITGAERALVDAVAAQPHDGRVWVLPGELAMASETNAVVTAFDSLLIAREAAAQCRTARAVAATSDTLKKEAAPVIAALDAGIARADALVTRVTAPGEGAPSQLAAAALAATLLEKHPNLLALRVDISQAGGTLLKRSNLWTALGAPAVGLTGGLVVSWRLFDPASGAVKSGGILVCRTALTNLNAIHKGEAGTPSCAWPTAEERAQRRRQRD